MNNGVPWCPIWNEARDLFSGRNQRDYSIPLAIELASKSQHPEAVWFCKVATAYLTDPDTDISIEAMEMDEAHLYDQCPTPGLWHYVLFEIQHHYSVGRQPLVFRAADLGYIRACSIAANWWDVSQADEHRFSALSLAAGDPMGLFLFGTKEQQLAAAHMGWVEAQTYQMTISGNPIRSLKWGIASLPYGQEDVFQYMRTWVERGNGDPFLLRIMLFMFYHAKKKIRWSRVNDFNCGFYRTKVEAMCKMWEEEARKECVWFVLCAKRLAGGAGQAFCRDIRSKIARLVWAQRVRYASPVGGADGARYNKKLCLEDVDVGGADVNI